MYAKKDLVRIAKRENNVKRNYLVVNPLQGKHIPVKPGEAFSLFGQLADSLRHAYENESILCIGFAETATAIGAAVAIELGAAYMQTTRETIPGVGYLFFSEEHSHATEQKLVKDDIDRAIGTTDRMIFVEDEVTTGKTILNIIDILEQTYPEKIKFSVASLLNGMDENARNAYKERDIRLHYLVKTDHRPYPAIAEKFAGNGTYVPCDVGAGQMAVPEKHDVGAGQMAVAEKHDVSAGQAVVAEKREESADLAVAVEKREVNADLAAVAEIQIDSWVDARRLVSPQQYQQACSYLWQEIDKRLHSRLSGKMLVLGTEEFMFPALFVAHELEKRGVDAVCHATTRSPILVGSEKDYPLHVRYELRSMYDKNRITYVYELAAYDAVLVISDAQNNEREGVYSLYHALKQKNESIYFIRWHG